jgi:hypothetical protein
VIKVDERILRPQALAQLLAGDHFLRTLKKRNQNLEWLQLQLQAVAVLTQLRRAKVGLKFIKFVLGNRCHKTVWSLPE